MAVKRKTAKKRPAKKAVKSRKRVSIFKEASTNKAYKAARKRALDAAKRASKLYKDALRKAKKGRK